MIEGRAVTLVLCGLVSQPDYTSTWSGVLPLHYNATWLSGRNDIHDGCVQLIIQPGVNSGTSKMHSEDECFNECGSDDCRDECSVTGLWTVWNDWIKLKRQVHTDKRTV